MLHVVCVLYVKYVFDLFLNLYSGVFENICIMFVFTSGVDRIAVCDLC